MSPVHHQPLVDVGRILLREGYPGHWYYVCFRTVSKTALALSVKQSAR
jgi:hypothetical protein